MEVQPAQTQTRGRSYCSVRGCYNTTNSRPDLSYFKHPHETHDIERRIRWLQLIGREELINKPGKYYTVCEEHFTKQDILPGRKRKILKSNALPSLRLCPTEPVLNSEEIIEMDTYIKIENCEDSPSSPDTPDETPPKPERKRKLLNSPAPGCSKTVRQSQNNSLVYLGQDTFHRLCNQFLTKELADIVKAQNNLQNYMGKKTLVFKVKCLYLYHSNPQAYRMLQDALQLPCIANLHKTATPITTEINADFMLLLESKVQTMTDMEKNCSAVIGSMSLKPNLFYNITHDKIIGFHDVNGVRLPEVAEKAYVMMVRGIYGNWEQPVGYALLPKGENSVEFNEWIDGLLEQLFDIGLNVLTFVSDTGSEYIKAAKNRSVTIEKPYFFINDKKVYYIFDAPHLLKLVRNFFIGHDFQFHDLQAKYEHVRRLYEAEKKKEYKLAPKITRNHIYPTNFEKKELRYATQLLSRSVATGISTYVDLCVIDDSGRYTADFIKLMNNLFDCLNSSDLKETSEYKYVYRDIKSQTELFKEMLIFFQNLKFVDTSFEPAFIEGFQITITSILKLFDDIRTKGCTYLQTRRLNMEIIDNFIDHVQTKCGMASKPTSWQFVSIYRKRFLSKFMKPQERKNSTAADGLAEWLAQMQSNKLKRPAPGEDKSDPDGEFDKVEVNTSDYNNWEFNKMHRLFEVSHCLLVNCAKKHRCRLFNAYIKPYKSIPDFIKDRRYSCYRVYSEEQRKGLLVVPCDNFVQFVKKIDAQFVQLFRMSCSRNNVGELLYNDIINIPYPNPPCKCIPKNYLVKLFIRISMYNALKFNNIAFNSNSSNIGKLVVNRL